MNPIEVLSKFKGFRFEDAQSLASNFGWTLREVVVDSEPVVMTADFDVRRANVVIEEGVITDVISIG